MSGSVRDCSVLRSPAEYSSKYQHYTFKTFSYKTALIRILANGHIAVYEMEIKRSHSLVRVLRFNV